MKQISSVFAFFGVLVFLFIKIKATELLFDDRECGSERTCHRTPLNCKTAEECASFVSFGSVDDDEVEFELWAPSKTEDGDELNYLAVGFSRDREMGDDAVTYCYHLSDGEQGIGMGVTQSTRFKPSTNTSTIDDTVKLKKIRVEDGQFLCKFSQKLSRGSNGDLLKPDLTDDSYYIFFVRGAADSKTDIHQHSFGPRDGPVISEKLQLVAQLSGEFSSNSSENARSEETESGPSNSDRFKRLHGAIMLLAWLALVFNAIYSARYLREHWPNTTVGGLQIWFHIHRTLNILSVLLIIAAVVLIFIGTKFTWTGPSASETAALNTTPTAIHSLIGLISVIFVLSQPLIALLRCGKDHPRRPIFNVIHRSFGLLAALLAVITIGIAIFTARFSFHWKNETAVRFIYVVFLIVSGILLLVQEVFRGRDRQKKQRITAIEMNSQGKPANSPSDSYYYQNGLVHSDLYRHITSILYVIFAGLSISVAVVLAYFALISSSH